MEKMQKFIWAGIPMIADDMMSFIKNDIIVFGNWGVFIYNFYSLVYFQKN